jgi:hypothetical protein
MRKLTIASTAFAASMILAACTPPAKEDESAAPEAEVVEAAPEPEAADPAAAKPDAAKAEDAAKEPAKEEAAAATEHTGGIKVAPSN